MPEKKDPRTKPVELADDAPETTDDLATAEAKSRSVDERVPESCGTDHAKASSGPLPPRPDLEIVVHPMDLAIHGKKDAVGRAQAAITRELTFTEAYQTWDERAQRIEDELLRAARGETDVDPIGRRIERLVLDIDQWETLYRLFLQVRLKRSPIESDALIPELDEPPPFTERLRGVGLALQRLWPWRREHRTEPAKEKRAA